uniref:Mu-theraphotoxin-Cg1a n=1 Tax=Chilobrachys guangxiensis TaxID=278060 RepID=JZT34_CHIGU|nr:RecName: Full=Mu-theraphotoxin-Cg1a; Short=Mu-TRTX-Cg1a; AltName: Full=Jingzhaotoxin-34; Short=JZTX-34; AltName: Full=Peptide F6-25.51; Flags: Precursor [Chilobrachys guangxiensis]ABY71707.1 cystine knot toxin [Chilobrachys guangxiensis]
MKVLVLITLAVLGAMFVWTSAAELEERGSDQRDSPAWVKSMERIFQSEERACREWLGGCSKDADCCAHLECRKKWPYHCVWDWTVRK